MISVNELESDSLKNSQTWSLLLLLFTHTLGRHLSFTGGFYSSSKHCHQLPACVCGGSTSGQWPGWCQCSEEVDLQKIYITGNEDKWLFFINLQLPCDLNWILNIHFQPFSHCSWKICWLVVRHKRISFINTGLFTWLWFFPRITTHTAKYSFSRLWSTVLRVNHVI